MNVKHRKQDERGFALLIVVMIVAAVSLVAVTLLNFINLDVIIAGQNKRTFEARAVADGAVIDLVDNNDLPNFLPDFTTANMQTVLSDPRGAFGAALPTPVLDTYFRQAQTVEGAATQVSADVRFLRYVPISNSSLNWSRALVYEVRAIGDVNNGESTSEVRAEVKKIASYAPGTLLPRRHAR